MNSTGQHSRKQLLGCAEPSWLYEEHVCQRAGVLLGGGLNAHSLAVQAHVAETFARDASLEIIEVYTQPNASDPPPPMSPLLPRILADVKSGRLQVLLCGSLEQLGDDLAQVAEVAEIFNAHGVRLISLAGGGFDYTSGQYRLLLQLATCYASAEGPLGAAEGD